LDILWLKDFESLAALKNFSRAAEERHVSQPAFSRRIRILEAEVGVSLINRETLPLSLTPAGELFLVQAQRILKTYAETIERCQIIDAADSDVIRFATTQSLYLTHYKSRIAPLVKAGGIDIDLNSTAWAADQFVTALQQHYCDVILTYWHPAMDFLSPLEVSKCDYLTLSNDRFLPVSRPEPDGSPRYRLPARGGTSVPLLGYGSASVLSSVVEHVLRQQLTRPNVLVVNHNGLAVGIKAMIQEDFGMGWLPEELCKSEIQNGTLCLAADPSYATSLEIRLYRDSENRKPSLVRLWRQLEDAL
jgi:DNA-binding transcriptional LysR family regulator|tara:strand:- start:2926 stop:3837 length:912 start_codon:yes stop_codon:yes gene_type:complete